jgi:hypothetical protein
MRVSSEEQNSKLKDALEARRAKRKNLRAKVADEKHKQINDRFDKNANNKVNGDSNDSRNNAEKMADKIAMGFEKDEQV